MVSIDRFCAQDELKETSIVKLAQLKGSIKNLINLCNRMGSILKII